MGSPRIVFSKRRIGADDEIKKAGVGYGREAGAHKYKRRVRVMEGGHLTWRYYYDDPKERLKQLKDQAAAVKHQKEEVERLERMHKPMSDFRPDHPTLAAARKLLKELNAEYVTSVLTWDKPPRVKIPPNVQQTYHEAVQDLYKDGAEPEDPHGKPTSVYRSMEFAFERMPSSIKQHFSGAINQINMVLAADDKLLAEEAGTMGYYRPNTTEIVVGMDRNVAHPGHHMRGGLYATEVLIHEMGHAVQYKIGAGSEKSETWNGKTWDDFKEFLRGGGASERAITGYAETNDSERFAESFTCALMYPRDLAHTAPRMYEWFREFFGPGAMRPIHTDENYVRILSEQRDAALKKGDMQRASELAAQIDASIGVLDMAEDDRRLQWWLPKETKVQQTLREAARPNYHAAGAVIHDPADKFYEMNVGGRTVYMRVGWNGNEDEPFSGWTPDADPRSGRIGLRNSEVKEAYDENGKALSANMIYWHLHQDAIPNEHPDAAALVSFDNASATEDNKKVIEAKDARHFLAQNLAQKFERGKDLTDSEYKMKPVAIDEKDFRQRSGTFTYDRFQIAGHTDMEVLRHSDNPEERAAALARLQKKQPNIAFEAIRDPKTKRITGRRLILDADPTTGRMVPRFHAIRYENPNPDGTTSVITCSRDEKSGRFFISNPMWRSLLTPNGEEVKSHEDLINLCRQASEAGQGMPPKARRAWLSVRTDTQGGDTEHFYHVEVEFDGRGQPKVLGDTWKRRLEKDEPRIDDLLKSAKLVDGKEVSRAVIKAEKIKLEKAPPKTRKKTLPAIGERVVLRVRGEELKSGARENKEVVARLVKMIPGKKKGEVPSPPGWDRMPESEPMPTEGEPSATLTKRERKLIKDGLLPEDWKGSKEQRAWLKDVFEPAYKKWEDTKDEVTAQELPARYVFSGEAGGGAGGQNFIRYGEDEATKTSRKPAESRKPKALAHDLLCYAHSEVDPITGITVNDELRLLLPTDGRITLSDVEGLPGVTVVRGPDVGKGKNKIKGQALGVRVNLDGFDQLRRLTGGLSLTSEAEAMVRAKAESLKKAVASEKKHSIEIDDIDPAKLKARGVGLVSHMPNGAPFELALHQQELVQKIIDNNGRALGAHYMGCVAGDTVINVNRGGKGFAITIAEAYDKQRVSASWDRRIATRARGMVVENDKIGLIDVAELWDSGVKTTYQLTLEDGRTIRTTDEHKFWTQRGWLRHDQLTLSDRVAVEAPMEEPGGRAARRAYRIRTNLPHHPHARGQGRAAMRFYVSTHRLVVEAHRNGVDFEEYVARLREGRDLEGFVFLDPAVHVHHKDHDIYNNEISNLEVLAHEDHAKEHGDADHFGLGRIMWLAVAERMASPREERTYDLTMTPETPSYIANGMVVHNTGKTISAIVAAKTMMKLRDPENPDQPHPNAPKKVLIVAPLNTVEQWRQACFDFDDGCSVVGVGKNDIPAKDYVDMAKEGRDTNDIVIVGPEYWTRNQAKLREAGFDGLIIDEAHMGLKNEETARNKALNDWNPDMKMLTLLTGTPVTVSPADWLEYVKVLSKGEQWAGMTRAQFTEEFLEETPVPGEFGVKGKKGPKTQVKASKREELSGILANYVHIATPKDVREKTLPAVRIEESKHAFMTGTQSMLYALNMAALSQGDLEALKANTALSDDEMAGLDDEARRKVQAAKAISNCAAYKPQSDERFVMTYDTVTSASGKQSKRKVEFQTFDPAWLMERPDIAKPALRKKLAGRWPSLDEVDQHRAALYTLHFAALLGQPYSELAGTKITEEQLARMKGDGWPRKLQNPEAGPLGIRCRGRDEPRQWENPEIVHRAAEFQRLYAQVLSSKIPVPGPSGKTRMRSPDPETAKMMAAQQYGVSPDQADEFLRIRPDATDHFEDVSYGNVTVNEGETWIADARGSLNLLYRAEDWDHDANKPKGAGGFEKVKDGDRVDVPEKLLAALRPKDVAKEDWVPPPVRYDASLGVKNGKVAVRSMEDNTVVWVPKEAISAYTPSLMDPGMRKERAKADVAMYVGNAKAEELAAHLEQFSPDSSKGEGGTRQMVLFGHGILDACRTMEATLRVQGYRDVNEMLEGSPHFDPSDPTTRGMSPNGKYYVTFIGSTYTGNRDLNVEVFKKTKDKLGRDSDTSLFVHKMKNGTTWRAYPSAEPSRVKLSDWAPETRDTIYRQFKIKAPESFFVDDAGAQRYFYGTKESGDILRRMVLVGDPAKMADPAVAESARAELHSLQAKYEALVKAGAVKDPPLKPNQEAIFNNCDLIVCSDAAQVGMNLGNAVEMVMYDSLSSPMAEWQRITRSARMLPPAVHADLMGKPVMEEATDENGNVLKDESDKPLMRLKFDENGKPLRDGTGPFAKIRAMEAQLFDPGHRGMPQGYVAGLKGFFSPAEPQDMSATQALNLIAAEAANRAVGPEAAAWAAIAARARVGANLGLNMARTTLTELSEMREPGGKDKLISFGSMQIPDPVSGTYTAGIEINPPEEAIRNAIGALPAEDKEKIRKAGFVKEGEAGSIDPVAVYFALRAQEVFDYIETQRPKVTAAMRASSAGAIVTESDVMNAIIDSLTPMDRAILKTKKYLVNVRRLGVAAHVPQMVRATMEDEEGNEKEVNVFAGYEKEYPVSTERNTRAMGRARMIPYEQMLTDIQNGVGLRKTHEYEAVGAEAIAATSRMDLTKSLVKLVFDLGRAHG